MLPEMWEHPPCSRKFGKPFRVSTTYWTRPLPQIWEAFPAFLLGKEALGKKPFTLTIRYSTILCYTLLERIRLYYTIL